MASQSRTARYFKLYGRLTIFMIPIGVAINVVGGQLAILLKLPVFLDTTGTMLVGALCGGIPGAIVGVLTNALNSITSPTNFPYALIQIGIAFLAAFLSRRGVFRSFWKTLVSSLGFAAIGGLGGAIITLILFGGFSGAGADFITAAFVAAGVPITTAVFLAAIPVALLDQLPQVLLVYLIIGRISTRLLAKLPLGSVYLRPSNSAPAASTKPTGVEA